MTERDNENLLYTISVLGDTLQTKEFMLRVKEDQITRLEGELAEAKNKTAKDEWYQTTIKEQEAYIQNLEAKIYDLEERIAIMTETEAEESKHDFPMEDMQTQWEITPPVEVTEVTNISKVIMEEDVQ